MMDSKFHALPPLKRLRLLQQKEKEKEKEKEQVQEHHVDGPITSTCLPAKKRKESREPAIAAASVGVCRLPAKKRVWAVQPDFSPIKSVSHFDLNVEYNPCFEGEREDKAELEEEEQKEKENGASVVNGSGQTFVETGREEGEEEEEDDGIECAVCQSTDGDPSDPIVFCDGCDLMVHATCYGNPLVKGVPEGDWFCNQCLGSHSSQNKKNPKAFSCCLCPNTGGAMKPTEDGRWAHIVCALLVPEVFFKDPEGRDGVDRSKVPLRRWKEKCYVCKSSNGCAIDCSEPKCPLAFHVTCGLREELCIEYREGRNKGGIVAGFCKNHTQLWKKVIIILSHIVN